MNVGYTIPFSQTHGRVYHQNLPCQLNSSVRRIPDMTVCVLCIIVSLCNTWYRYYIYIAYKSKGIVKPRCTWKTCLNHDVQIWFVIIIISSSSRSSTIIIIIIIIIINNNLLFLELWCKVHASPPSFTSWSSKALKCVLHHYHTYVHTARHAQGSG